MKERLNKVASVLEERIGARPNFVLVGLLALGAIGLGALIVHAVERPPVALPSLPSPEGMASVPTQDLLETARLEASKPENTDWSFVGEAARTAVRQEPLNAGALALYGFSLGERGETERATKTFQSANVRDPRLQIVNVWLFNQSVAAGQFEDALSYADLNLRLSSRFSGPIYEALAKLARVPDGLTAVIDALSQDPPWRRTFLNRLARNPDNLPIAYAVVSALEETRSPPSTSELAPVLDAMIANGAYQNALFLWIGTLPEDRSAGLDYISNGDFRFPLSGLPFDWTLSSQSGTEISLAPTKGADQALQLNFYRGRLRGDFARKLLVLAPGSYTLSFREKAEKLGFPRGLRWELSCVEAKSDILAASPPLKGSVDWRSTDVSFEVPSTDCPAQWLRLQIIAEASIDKDTTGGSAWYTDFTIDRVNQTVSN